MKGLIITNHPSISILLKQSLHERSVDFILANNRSEAFERWNFHRPQVVILDMTSLHDEGFTLIRDIRKAEMVAYTYILVLTHLHQEKDLERLFECGADDVLMSPFLKRDVQIRLKSAKRILSLFDQQILIDALMELTETRDLETGEHIERIRRYVQVLAMSLKKSPKYAARITPSFIELLTTSSALHDIGKVGIEDRILKKRGRYTDGEREIMKRHSILGYETLERVQSKYPSVQFLKMAAEIAHWHHERYDGFGYPDGLKEDEIPLSAQIVSLSDVFDALVTERIYKKQYSFEQAKNIIVKEANKQFSSDLVDAFLRCQEEFQAIATRFHVNTISNSTI